MADYPIRIRTGIEDRIISEARRTAKDNFNDTSVARELHLETHLSNTINELSELLLSKHKDYEIKYVKYDEDGDWLIITKTKGNLDYWCFHFNIEMKQVMLSQVRRNKVVYEGCLMFYFGNYIIG